MKKLLSILMTLVMLLSACAFAEGSEIVLGDIVVLEGETPLLDLTGLDLIFGVYNGETSGLQLALAAADQEVLALNAAIAEDQLLLGMTGVPDVYSVDLATALESLDIDLDAIAELDVEEATSAISEADQLALAALAMEAAAIVQAGVTDAGTEEIDGVTYEVTAVDVTAEQLRPLMEKAAAILDNYSYLLEDSGIESFSQLYETLSPALAVSGAILDSENSGIILFDVTGSVFSGTEEEVGGYIELYLEGDAADEENIALYVELTIGSGEESYTLTFDLNLITGNDGSWMPASDAPVDLIAALEDEAQSQQLMLQASSALMMALSQMAAANETVAALLSSAM